MGVWWWVLIVAGIVVGVAIIFGFWRPLRRLGHNIQAERAQELFRLQRERLELSFLPAAAATGKPRGLRWVDCSFDDEVVFARDRNSRELLALVGVTIRFEAIEGSDMEGLAAVGNLRNASAVFYFHKGRWNTAGKAVFNLNPAEAVEHFHTRYERIGADDSVPG
jgi:hypothetical protein